MSETLRWWLVLQLIALPMLPLCLAVFRRLPDRGYALSKTFALLLLGYAFWFLNSIRVLPNSPRGILAALALLTALSAAFAYRERDALVEWGRDHARYIIGVELLFIVTFFGAVFLRSLVGQIQGTEQPMDLMLLNAATQAEHFPPKDPWLSGHTVAYYYFGFLIVAMTGMLAGVPAEIGYNIGLGMIASLAMLGAFCIVYNLVKMREQATGADAAAEERRSAGGIPFNWRPPAFAGAGALMLVVMGNLVWVFVFASAYGIGGQGLYDWIDVSGLTADEPRRAWYPSAYFGFFNASRIYPLNNDDFRVITEFPMFSFLLGDLHPHVMSLPFVLLIVGAALALYRSPEPLDITYWLQRPLLLVTLAIMLGGLAFMNTWDIATMAFVVVAAAFVSNFRRTRALTLDLAVQVGSFAVPFVLLAVLLYLPFYISFTSQADGVLPVVTRSGITEPGTRPFHMLLYWGPLLAVVVPFIAARLLAMRERITRRDALIAAALPAAIMFAWVVLFLGAKMFDVQKLEDAGGLFEQIGDRGTGWITAIFIGAMLAAAGLALWLELTAEGDREERESPLFALLLAFTAFLLMLGTEFFYVGDVFNGRMNTVFKLYYQGWMMLAVAGGFALYYLVATWRPAEAGGARTLRLGWAAGVAIVLAGAALYPLGGTFNRVSPYNAEGAEIKELRGLDGISRYAADELAAIDWLRDRAKGQKFVIVEAFCPQRDCLGNDYSAASRISAATGAPTVLGWAGHEDQWRGGSAKARGTRLDDVERLYETDSMAEVEQIVAKYGITYIYVGGLERSTYGTAVDKFATLEPVFQQGGTAIYLARGGASEVETSQ